MYRVEYRDLEAGERVLLETDSLTEAVIAKLTAQLSRDLEFISASI